MDQNQTNPEQLPTEDKTPSCCSSCSSSSQRWWAWPLVIVVCAVLISTYKSCQQDRALSGPSIEWLHDYNTAVAQAQQENKPLLIVFSREGCPGCDQMKRRVYPHPDVLQASEAFVPVYVDTNVPENGWLIDHFRIEVIPTYVIQRGNTVVRRFLGPISPDEFIEELQTGINAPIEPTAGEQP
ncbi:MAG: thioredoxin family protein [Sedimentisphaerales bacterium]|nr:thioredoxin family protein [Sedimentisphaerales bacterium]